jgi:lipoprotein NlpD
MPSTFLNALIILPILCLVACTGGGSYAPVSERKIPSSLVPKAHSVVRGETLFSIAWLYNMDFKRLGTANKLAPPYVIYPGQRLLLQYSNIDQKKLADQSLVKSIKKKTSRKQQVKKRRVGATTGLPSTDSARYPYRWQWPIKGKVITAFSSASAVHKGIDIKGKLGESVHAANSGKVVYAGSGLVGYGKLLIIKHDEQYLSAYGHNNKLLVKEDELVKVGQRIAEVGDTGTHGVKLHFEIRRDGKPVNPLKLLK